MSTRLSISMITILLECYDTNGYTCAVDNLAKSRKLYAWYRACRALENRDLLYKTSSAVYRLTDAGWQRAKIEYERKQGGK